MSFVVTDLDFLPDSTSLLQGLGKKPQISTESRGEMFFSVVWLSSAQIRTFGT